MSYDAAFQLLKSRLRGAPNWVDYQLWLTRQPEAIVIALANGERVDCPSSYHPKRRRILVQHEGRLCSRIIYGDAA